MEKIMKVFKDNVKTMVVFVIGGIICGGITTVLAYSMLASSVSYNNANSGSSATNVQGAIDDLFTRTTRTDVNQSDCESGYTKQNESSTGYECKR